MASYFICVLYMHQDALLWIIILGYTYGLGLQNIDVIHGEYTLDNRHKLNMFIHQFIMNILFIGVLFKSKIFTLLHLFTVFILVCCWFYFDGCILAQWERENIPYTPNDLVRLHFTEEKRQKDFLMTSIPILFIDVAKILLM